MADSLEDRLKDSNSDNLEAKVKNSNGHSNPEIINFLEEKAKQRKPRGLFGKIMDYTISIGCVAASYALIGSMALVANAIGFIGDRIVNYRRKRDTPSRKSLTG